MNTTLAAHPRRIGILGGMGPAATVDLLQKIIDATPAARDQDHVPTVVWNVPQIPERLAAMRGEGPSPLPGMIEGARALESVGCEVLAVACNTAHHWADDLRASVHIPLLHIAVVAVKALSERIPLPDTVGLLATRGTLQSGFYQRALEARGFRVRVPDDREQSEGIDAAIRAVKVNRVGEGQPLFNGVAQAMMQRGCGALVLACTELPLLLPGCDLAWHCVDTNETLARAIVKAAFGGPIER